MSAPEEPFIIPVGDGGFGRAKWVALAALIVVTILGGWLVYENHEDSRVAAATADTKRQDQAELERRREEGRRQAGSGTPLASAHKRPPGWKPPKNRIPSKELFDTTVPLAGGLLPTPLPGRHFGIDLPATWEHTTSASLMTIQSLDHHFTIVASSGTLADDGETAQAIDKIGAVRCNWQKGDGPKRGQIGAQRIPAFFNEGVCGHTDGYGLIWILRLYAGDHVTSLVARYTADAGEDAEDVLLEVLRTVTPIE